MSGPLRRHRPDIVGDRPVDTYRQIEIPAHLRVSDDVRYRVESSLRKNESWRIDREAEGTDAQTVFRNISTFIDANEHTRLEEYLTQVDPMLAENSALSSRALYVLTRVNSNGNDLHLRSIAERQLQHLLQHDDYHPTSYSNSLVALNRLGFTLHDRSVPEFVERGAAAMMDVGDELHPIHVNSALSSLAGLGVTAERDTLQPYISRLIKEATLHLQNGKLKKHGGQMLSNPVSAVAQMGLIDRQEVADLIDVVCGQDPATVYDCTEQQATNTAWGLGVLSLDYDIPDGVLNYLGKAAQEIHRAPDFAVRQLYHAETALLGDPDEDTVRRLHVFEECDTAWATQTMGADETELINWIEDQYPKLKFGHNVLLHGYQHDLLSIPDHTGRRINIEIDGPQHELQKPLDRFRQWILEQHNVAVVRVPISDIADQRTEILKMLISPGRYM